MSITHTLIPASKELEESDRTSAQPLRKNQQPTKPTSELLEQKPPSKNRQQPHQTTQDEPPPQNRLRQKHDEQTTLPNHDNQRKRKPPNPKMNALKDATTKRSTHQQDPNQQHGGNQPTDEPNQNQPRMKHET